MDFWEPAQPCASKRHALPIHMEGSTAYGQVLRELRGGTALDKRKQLHVAYSSVGAGVRSNVCDSVPASLPRQHS
jgi:hypothetical protein